MGMGRDNSLPDTPLCPTRLVPSGTLWAGGGESLISDLMFCFAFASDWTAAKMVQMMQEYCTHIPFPQSQSPELLSSPALEWHSTFTLCKPQVFSLKSCKKLKELGYQKCFRQNVLIVLISFLNFCVMLLHTMFRPNFTFETALFYTTQLTECVFLP